MNHGAEDTHIESARVAQGKSERGFPSALEQRRREHREHLVQQAKSNGDFATFRLRLYDLQESLPWWGKVRIGGPARRWDSDALQKGSEILLQIFKLLEAQQSGRAKTHLRDIERLLEHHLGHRDAEMGVAPEVWEECSEIEVHTRHDALCDALFDKLGALAREFPVPVEGEGLGPANRPDTPDGSRECAMKRLGRKSMSSLEQFVSNWRRKHGQDLPWVIRKPGMKWRADTDALDQWLKTSEGEKARKRGRGRPRKNRYGH